MKGTYNKQSTKGNEFWWSNSKMIDQATKSLTQIPITQRQLSNGCALLGQRVKWTAQSQGNAVIESFVNHGVAAVLHFP